MSDLECGKITQTTFDRAARHIPTHSSEMLWQKSQAISELNASLVARQAILTASGPSFGHPTGELLASSECASRDVDIDCSLDWIDLCARNAFKWSMRQLDDIRHAVRVNTK